jgi:hypothetical protein
VSRRQHVVRSDDQGGVGALRSLGGCTILCATDDCGNAPDGDSGAAAYLAILRVESRRDFQRCFVAATIADISAFIPDPEPPPGPGTWIVRFECPVLVTSAMNAWESYSYVVPGAATLSELRYERASGGPVFVDWGWLQDEDAWDPFATFMYVERTEVPDPPVDVAGMVLSFVVDEDFGPAWVEMVLSSPTGEHNTDVIINDGTSRP